MNNFDRLSPQLLYPAVLGLAGALAEDRPVAVAYRRPEVEFPAPMLSGFSFSHAEETARSAEETPLSFMRCRGAGSPQEEVIRDAEAAFLRAGLDPLGNGRANAVLDGTGRIAGRLNLVRPIARVGSVKFIGLMGPAERQLIPRGMTGRLAWYVWDCWPNRQDRWQSMFDRWKPEFVFFASRSAARFWGPRLPGSHVQWAPEAVESGIYLPGPELSQRRTTLLEIGRRHPEFHDRAARYLSDRGAKHIHSRPELPFVFPDRRALVQGLQSSVASICYPGSWTDPNGRTGSWESMTHRYLEAAATKTLIVGAIPGEMKDLFGFTPGIEIDPSCPEEVLQQLVDDPAQYQHLVDRTHQRLQQVATWDVRVAEMLSVVRGLADQAHRRA